MPTIDQKVVELKFDNRDFERNTRQSMSTLEKLKEKLNFKGASKGLEEIEKTSKQISFEHMESSLAAIEKRFSTTGIVGMTVIQELTKAGMNMAKQFADFTIGGITEGGKARATKIENAKFQLQGLLGTTKKAKKQLADIMQDVDYGVKDTAYGLDAAASVASQLAASGMRAGEGMRHALRGISGVAAMTNSTYEDIGRIYTTIAGNGRLMGDQLLQLSSRGMNVAATLGKYLHKSEAEVRDMVSHGKISFQTFADAMDDAFGQHAKDANNTLNGVILNIKAALSRIGAAFYQPLIAEKSPLVIFLNSVRERINEIKKTLDPITKEITDRINKFITKVDALFKKSANILGFKPLQNFSKTLVAMKKPLNAISTPLKSAAKQFDKVSQSLKQYEKLMNNTIRGDWGNGQARYNALTKAGYNYYKVQNMVNEKLGYSFRYSDKVVAARDKEIKGTTKAVIATKDLAKSIETLTEKEMKELGFTNEQIKAFSELKKMSDKTGLSVKELLDLLEHDGKNDNSVFSSRYLLFNSIKNIGLSLATVLKSVAVAFGKVFSIDASSLFDGLAAFHKWTEHLKDMLNEKKNFDNLVNTFRGLFSILKLIGVLVGSGFRIAWLILTTVLDSCGMTLLDFTGAVGNVISSITDFIIHNDFLIKGITWLVRVVGNVIKAFREWTSQYLSFNLLGDAIVDAINYIQGIITRFIGAIRGKNSFGDLGKFIVDGLKNGITDNVGKVLDAMLSMGRDMIAAICKVLGIHSPSKEMYNVGQNTMKGLFNGIKDFAIYIYDLIRTIGAKIIEIIKDIDIGSVIVIGVSALGLLIANKIANALAIIANGIVAVNDFINAGTEVLLSFRDAIKRVSRGIQFKLLADGIKSIAIAIAILVGSIVVLSKMEWSDIQKGLEVIGILLGAIIAMGAIAYFGGKNAEKMQISFMKMAAMILAIGIALKIMASALKTISKIDKLGLEQLGAIFLLIVGLLGSIYLITRSEKDAVKMGGTLLAIGVALRLMAGVVKTLGKIDGHQLAQGMMAITLFGVIIAGLMLVTRYMTRGVNFAKIGGTLALIGLAFYEMARVVKILGKMDRDQLIQGGNALAQFAVIIVGLMFATKLLTGSRNVAKIGPTIALIGVAFTAMAVAVKILGKLEQSELNKGLFAVGAFTLIVIGLIHALGSIGAKKIENIGMTLFAISACIGVMALSAALLSLISIEGLAKGIIAIGLLSLCVMGMIKATRGAENVYQNIWAITAAIGVMTVSLALLSLINPEKLIGPVIALGTIMGMFALIIKAASGMSGTSVAGIGVMIGVVVVLAIVIAELSKLDTNAAIKSTLAISILMLAMAGVLAILGAIGGLTSNALLGVVGMLALCVILISLVGILAVMSKVENAAKNATILAKFIGVLTIVLIATALVGTLYAATAGLAATGLLGLAALLPILLGVIALLAAINLISNAEANAKLLTSFLEVMTEALIKIAIVGPLALMGVAALYGLISVMGVMLLFITTIGALITYIPQIQQFMNTGLKLFIELAGGLGEMIGAFVKGALTQISSGLPEIGTNLSMFMINVTPFIVGAKMVDNKVLKGVEILAASILLLTAAEFINGVANFLSGGSSLADLGTQLSQFMTNAMPFIMIASTLNESMMAGVKTLASAILTLTAADLVKSVTNFITGGSSSLAEFGEQLPALGSRISEFAANLGDFSESQVNTVRCAGEAIKALAEAAGELPNEGGIWASIFGDNSLSTFANDLPDIGKQIASFVTNLGEFSDPQIKTAEAAGKVIVALADAADKIPNEGGQWAKLFGDNSLSQFAGELPKVAKGINSFVKELNGFNDKTSTVDSAVNVIKSLANLGKINLKDTSKNLPSFGKALGTLGKDLTTFMDKLSKLNSKDLETASGNLGIITKAVKNMIDTIASSAKKNTSTATKAFEQVGKDSANALGSNSVMSIVKNKGRDFVQGFANGISANSSIATNAASNMATSALNAVAAAQKSHSPSKETRKLGGYFGQGFVIGVKDYAGRVYSIGSDIGNQAKKGLSNAVSKISDILGSDMDTQPTIRPVLDLNNITDGINTMNSMFSDPSVNMMANLNSISNGMNNKIQNGNNQDVISAINKLNSTLSGNTGNTYNINGVTYDDGSNVADAVETLIRAVNVERRA